MTTTILNRIMMAAGVILLPTIAYAQEAADTVVAQELNEIVIEAPKVIRKADMDVYHPSKSAVENSKNGMQLLNNLISVSLRRWKSFPNGSQSQEILNIEPSV